MRYYSKILIWFVISGGLGFSLGFGEVFAMPISHAIEQAKLATVGILQAEQLETPDNDYGLPVKIRGSGIHLGRGVIVTARHAVERPEGGKVVIPDTIHVVTDDLIELPAVRQGANAYLDVAVYQLQAPESDWPHAHVAFADGDVTYGDQVFTVGYPLGWGPAINFGTTGNPNTFLSTVHSRLVQVDMSVCNGNSGGGLLNQHGQLVGLIHAIIQTETQHEDRRCSRLAFALPGLLVQRVVTAVLAGTVPGFSVLGIQLQTMRMGSRWALVVAKATGPSRHAGFRKGDVLLAINDVPITTPAQLKNYLIERTEPGQAVVLRVQRGDSQELLSVTLGQS
ncbi:MAG: S1C family serine protease [Nitrospirota bacterium]|nr:S1C family serine protease [Nitrospirota bacterium]MDH5699953.1 S1C family serine protease [Nitrospirota bacterium]